MRRKGIAPEYQYVDTPGTFNIIEQKSFMGSKLMSTEDNISIEAQDIVYYQQLNGEQLNLNQEINISKVTYSSLTTKKDNHKINLDKTQDETEKNGRTKWVININLVEILRTYIFTKIKEQRSFSNILNEETSFKSVDDAIRRYIDNNIASTYEFNNIDLYLRYLPLSDEEKKRYDVNYDFASKDSSNLSKKYSLSFNRDKTYLQLFFTQEKSSKDFTFNYYFDLHFIKK